MLDHLFLSETDNEDEMPKIPVNEESNDSPHGMVIDEGDEQASVPEEKNGENQSISTDPTVTFESDHDQLVDRKGNL